MTDDRKSSLQQPQHAHKRENLFICCASSPIRSPNVHYTPMRPNHRPVAYIKSQEAYSGSSRQQRSLDAAKQKTAAQWKSILHSPVHSQMTNVALNVIWHGHRSIYIYSYHTSGIWVGLPFQELVYSCILMYLSCIFLCRLSSGWHWYIFWVPIHATITTWIIKCRPNPLCMPRAHKMQRNRWLACAGQPCRAYCLVKLP